MSLPDHSPFIANDLVCHTCANKMKMKVVKGPRGHVAHIEYTCKDPSHDPYTLKSNAMMQAEMSMLRPDGTEARPQQ